MPPLSSKKRASLRNAAFAYIDSEGRRKLPIHDKAHVKNALARFNRVAFENDAARERARKRLLNAAKKYGIVPVGFIAGQLHSERAYGQAQATAAAAAALPTGFVTFLMTDIEASTALVHALGDRYRDVLNDVRGILRATVSRAGGLEIDARADEFFAVFERAGDSVKTAAAIQRAVGERARRRNVDIRIRIGIHSGRPTLTDLGYIGVPIHTAARVCSAAHGGQIIISGETRAAMGLAVPAGIDFQSLGRHRLPGITNSVALFQVVADGLAVHFPRPRTGTGARRRR
jgi:class 3 adenylate cyclase